MKSFKQIGFIGGGRVTEFLLSRLESNKALPEEVLISDPNVTRREKIGAIVPETILISDSNCKVARADLVFLAVHPPVLETVISEIKGEIKPDSIIVSLLPMATIRRLTESLGGFTRIVRLIPNAPSIIGRGFNPVAFSSTLSAEEKNTLHVLFINWGESPEVPEEQLEAYAILTGMGPTYFWFQWLELLRLAEEFGIEEDAAQKALSAMLIGAAETLFNSGIKPEEVLDLIPSYPLKKQEETIRQIFNERLSSLYQKLIQERK
jgi:pyrroline-5-carboxylate reductase